jgi:hypothetical protein
LEATTVFEEFLGIPAHPLVVHAAVVFVPLQVLAAIVYAVFGFTRRYFWWAVLALAVVGPLSAWAAKLSGDAFRTRKITRGQASGKFLDDINTHAAFGLRTAYFATGLGVLMLVLVLVVAKRPTSVEGAAAATMSPVVTWTFAVIVIAAAAASGYYCVRTGDSGAHLVWTGS